MNIIEMADLVAKVQMGDNRTVDETTIEYWYSLIGDLSHGQALDALRRFRRERPGTYLEPGHLLELSGVIDEPAAMKDITQELIEQSRARTLAAAGVSEEEFAAHQTDEPWLRAHFPDAFETTGELE